MSRLRARYGFVVTMATLVMVGTACGSSGSPQSGGTQSAKLTAVQVGCNRELSEVFLWGINPYLKRYGLIANCTEFPTYTASLQALAKGSIDVGIVGIPQLDTMAANGLSNVKVIAGYTLGGQNIVLGNQYKSVTSWQQLAGKTIGVPSGTGVAIMVDIALSQEHLLTKVHTVSAGFNPSSVILALQKKQWTGFAYWSPVTDQAVQSGDGFYPRNIDVNCTTVGPANGLIAANTSFLQKKTEVVNFLKGYVASMAAMAADPQKWAMQGSELTSTPLNVTKSAINHQQPSYDIDVQAAKNAAPYGPVFGFAKTNAAGQIDNSVDASFLAQATGKSVAAVTARATMPASKSACGGSR